MGVKKHFEDYQFQTKLKHQVLRKYLVPWAKILGRDGKRVIYFDGFAGEGSYGPDAKAGSPVIAAHIAKELRAQGIDILCIFLEEDVGAAKLLQDRLITQGFKLGSEHGYVVYTGTFDDAVRRIRKNSTKIPPTFFFVDPCGWTGYSMASIRALLKYEKCEVLINFMFDHINRFIASEKRKNFGWTDLFGTDAETFAGIQERLRELKGKKKEREEYIRRTYTAFLQEVGKARFVQPMAAKYGTKERTYFYLYHCSNNFTAAKIMRDVMHSATDGTYGYIPREDEDEAGQLFLTDALITEHNLLELRLFTYYSGKTVTFREIMEGTWCETHLREPDYRKILQSARKENRVTVKPVSSKKYGLKELDEVTFPSHKVEFRLPFLVGDRVRHKRWGSGTVKSTKGNILVAVFPGLTVSLTQDDPALSY